MLYEKLKEIYKDRDIPYSQLLLTDEWNNRRKEIIRKNKGVCLRCEKTGSYLNDDGKLFRLVKVGTQQELELGCYDWMEEFISRPIYLEVYPKISEFKKLLWEYKDDNLFICCSLCIQVLHIKYGSPIFMESPKGLTMECPKCEGKGELAEFDHIHKGVCFRCKGKGKIFIS